jgi:hypothetical protein
MAGFYLLVHGVWKSLVLFEQEEDNIMKEITFYGK